MPLPKEKKKWFASSYFNLLQWCSTGCGAIAPPNAGIGWMCGGQIVEVKLLGSLDELEVCKANAEKHILPWLLILIK